MKNLSIVVLIFLLLGCARKIAQKDLHLLNGYWEISQVTFPDGNKKEYTLSTSVDFIEVKGDKGFRKKVQPKLNGTFSTSDDAEAFLMIATENGFDFSYKNTMSEWKEQLIELSKDQFSVENENGIRYEYKRFHPINIIK